MTILFWILLLAVAFIAIPFAIALLFAIWFTIVWAVGMPISITVKSEKIGTVRWFTFTPSS